VPANAQVIPYGNGWECDRGFAMVNGACVAFRLPLNSHPGAAGSDWDCDAGYSREHSLCLAQK
jgi:hypothetical protein